MRPLPIVGYAQGSGPAPYFMRAMHFDGVSTSLYCNDYLANTPDSPIGTISMWVKIDTSVIYNGPNVSPPDMLWGTYNQDLFVGVSTNVANGAPFLWFYADNWNSTNFNDGSVSNFQAYGTPGCLLNNQWTHFLISWNTFFPAGQKLIAIYVNGVKQINAASINDLFPAFSLPYKTCAYHGNFDQWLLGTGESGKYIKGDFADIMMWTNVCIAQPGNTIAANDIANFIRAGAPLPTRIAVAAYGVPAVRFAGDATTFPTNQGTGGVFQLRGAASNGFYAPFDLDFTTSPYPAGVLTTTRASVGYADDLSGNWTQFAANTARITNKGLLVEEQRINVTRNNSMQGAVAGTPGTLPTNWSFINGPGSLSRSVVGTGTFNGVDYIDIRLFGTSSQGVSRIVFDLNNVAAAANGQTWTSSFFFQMVGGSFANITNCGIEFLTYNSTPTLLSVNSTMISTPTVQPLSWKRYVSNNTIVDATTAFVQQSFEINYLVGAAIDITLRIGWPQLENNNLAGASTASATVVNGGTVATYAVGDVLTVVGGVGTATQLTVTGVSAGQVTSVNVSVAGSYNPNNYPASPASVTGGGGTGATFNLTPVSLALSAFATSPIRTTAAAATRNADVVTVTNPISSYAPTYSMFAAFNPIASVPNGTNQIIFGLDDGTNNNRSQIFRQNNSNNVAVTIGPTGTIGGIGVALPGVVSKVAVGYMANNTAVCLNGGAIGVNTNLTPPTTLPIMHVGCHYNATWPANSYITRVAVWPTARLPNSYLTSITT